MKKTIKIIYIFLIIIFAILIIYIFNTKLKFYKIETGFNNFMSEFRRNGNSYISFIGNTEKYIIIKKDGKKISTSEKDGNLTIDYYDGNDYSKIYTDKKIVRYLDKEDSIKFLSDYNGPSSTTLNDYFFRNNSSIEIRDIKEDSFEGKKCYVIDVGNFLSGDSIYIDMKTYEPIGIMASYTKKYICKFELNCVKDEDFKNFSFPDISDYKVLYGYDEVVDMPSEVEEN